MNQAPGSPRGFFLALPQGQPVGWVERSETHHPATRTPPRKRWVSPLALPILRMDWRASFAARRMGRAQRNPSSRDPDPAAQSGGFRLWLYPSYGWIGGRPRSPSEGSRTEEHTSELQSLMRLSYAAL